MDDNGVKIELMRDNTAGINVYVYFILCTLSCPFDSCHLSFFIYLSGTQSYSKYI